MELHLSIVPAVQSVRYVDEQTQQFLELHQIPFQREIVFIIHELIINAIEAMEKCKEKKANEIEVHIKKEDCTIHMQVIDGADGIPTTQANELLHLNMQDVLLSERGRGLLFIQHMADRIFFKTLDDHRFAVHVEKIIR